MGAVVGSTTLSLAESKGNMDRLPLRGGGRKQAAPAQLPHAVKES